MTKSYYINSAKPHENILEKVLQKFYSKHTSMEFLAKEDTMPKMYLPCYKVLY